MPLSTNDRSSLAPHAALDRRALAVLAFFAVAALAMIVAAVVMGCLRSVSVEAVPLGGTAVCATFAAAPSGVPTTVASGAPRAPAL